MIAPISTTIVGKTTLPVTWRPLFKEGCFPFRSQPGTLSSLSFFFLFFFCLIFLGLLYTACSLHCHGNIVKGGCWGQVLRGCPQSHEGLASLTHLSTSSGFQQVPLYRRYLIKYSNECAVRTLLIQSRSPKPANILGTIMGPQKPIYYLSSLAWKGLQLSGGVGNEMCK